MNRKDLIVFLVGIMVCDMRSKTLTADPEAWQAYLRAQIPLCGAMELGVETISAQGVTLSLPLPPNRNHQGFGFGGSIVCLGLMAGWTLLRYRLNLESFQTDLVIYREVTHFKRPVKADMRATCTLDDFRQWQDFVDNMTRHDRAKLRLEPVVQSGQDTVATLKAEYVAMTVGDGSLTLDA